MASNTDFLTGLGGILNQQFETGDNKLHSLDIAQDGHTRKYGQLGDFAKQVDQSAERSYLESGTLRNSYNNPQPNQMQVLLQDPDCTVLVKKRAFASLAENFKPNLMDAHEKLFYRATKVLFQNKCKQISAYEKLSKIEQISSEIGRVDYHLLPIIFSLTDTITQVPGSLGATQTQDSINGALSGFKNIVDRVREITSLSQDAQYTSWITAVPDSFRTGFGEGTGVIEFTNVTSFSTTVGLKFAQGSFNLTFSDPYKIMRITNLDIEQAISDASNKFYSNSFIQLGIQSLDQTISLQKRQLNFARAQRGAQPIRFLVDPDTYLGKRVRAIIDNIGFEIIFDASSVSNLLGGGPGGTTIDPSALQGSDQAGNNGLAPNEITVFNNIVSALYSQISLSVNTRRQAMADNQDPKKNLNSVRKKLRLHYAGKEVIQPMDNVHIYIGSKKKIDNKILGGLQSSFSGLGFMQGLNNLTQDLKDTIGVDLNYSLEKSMFVGSDFPNWLWQIMRSQFVSDKNGAHVFSGIVENASMTYNNGTYNVRVDGRDNAAYFDYGIVNFAPSNDVFNGSLYDPMTPFKLEFDSVTGVQTDKSIELLDENKDIFNSAFVKDKNGLYAGVNSSINNFLTQDADRVATNSIRRVFYDPEGMVYRWKEGIATLVFGKDTHEDRPDPSLAPSITSNPFAGQDIMNILSLLITGEPYNYATYYKAALEINGAKREAGSNQQSATSYLRGLTNQIKYRNSIYGNFVPFKLLTVDEASLSKIINNQLNAVAYDGELQSLVEQRVSLADKLSIFAKTSAQDLANAGTGPQNLVANAIANIDTQINDKINQISATLNQSSNPPITVIGNDISFDYDQSNLNSAGSKTRLDPNVRKDLRRKIAFLTRRLAWKVRANEDMNLLIVDDTYDKDYDIQAFVKTFVNPEIFKSEYMTVANKISSVTQVINGMEIFANTQGHIEIRNPKYNRMPSSVFYRMLRMKDDLGIQVFPQFLQDLLVSNVSSIYQQIEVLEDEIRLFCAALGRVTDADCVSFINGISQGISGANGTAGGFFFMSDESSGKISNPVSLNAASQPDALANSINTALTTSGIQSQTSLNLFSIAARASLVQSIVAPPLNNPTQFSNLPQIIDSNAVMTREQLISNRLQNKTGQTFDSSQLPNIKTSTVVSTDILQVSNEIATRLSERQANIKQAVSALKNLQEGLTLFSSGGGPGNQALGNALLTPTLNRSKNIPQTFEHMLEDESYDDLGPGSGSRYVLQNKDIFSYTVQEKRPDMTSIEVTGRMSGLYVDNNQLPDSLKIFQDGNAMVTAAAVDYDLWRMYGIAVAQPVDAPYLSDPDTQMRPYAVSLLSKARKSIFTATAEIVGNEYQQPGEVVYIEDLDTLFYVDTVSHNFSYGSTFRTSLTLTYGHNPGEYIPTFLDVIGKMLYKNNINTTNIAHKRQGNVFNQEHVATIVGNYNPSSGDINFGDVGPDITENSGFKDSNRLSLQKILDYAASVLATADSTITPMLELRIYYNSSNASFSSANSYAVQLQGALYNYLIGASDLSSNTQPTATASTNQDNSRLSAFKAQIMGSMQVDTNKSGEFRYASATSIYYAREIADKSSQSSQSSPPSQQSIDNAIYSYMVDCWIISVNPEVANARASAAAAAGNSANTASSSASASSIASQQAAGAAAAQAANPAGQGTAAGTSANAASASGTASSIASSQAAGEAANQAAIEAGSGG